MITVENGARGSAITAEDSALVGKTGYLGQGEPAEGTAMVDEPLREALTLLVRIAGTDDESEQQSLLGRLIVLQRQNNELVARMGVGVEKLVESGGEGNWSFSDYINFAAAIVTLAGSKALTKGAPMLFSALGEAATGAAAAEAGEILTIAGTGVVAAGETTAAVLTTGMVAAGETTAAVLTTGAVAAGETTAVALTAGAATAGETTAVALTAGAATAGVSIGAILWPIAAVALAAGGVYYLATHKDEWMDENQTGEAKSNFLERVNEGIATKEDFEDYYHGGAYGRKEYLAYIYDKDHNLYEQEIAIAGPAPDISFSDADRIRKEKGLPEPQPTPLKPVGGEMVDWLHSQDSALYPDTESVLNGNGNVVQSPFSGLGTPHKSKENELPGLYITNGSAVDVAKSANTHENVPDAPIIKRKPHGTSDDGSILTNGVASEQKITNPLTGAWEGPTVAFTAGAQNTSPYQLEGMSIDQNSAIGAQGGFSERLAAALERMAEVCALPRVSVGTLAGEAVVREEADLDTLARRFADELMRAQMVS